MKVVYIAGPMSGLPDLGRKHFREAEKRLKEAGYIALNPAVLPKGMEKDRYMPICLAVLEAADAVYMLQGWRSSAGAQMERAYAQYQGKEIWEEMAP